MIWLPMRHGRHMQPMVFMLGRHLTTTDACVFTSPPHDASASPIHGDYTQFTPKSPCHHIVTSTLRQQAISSKFLGPLYQHQPLQSASISGPYKTSRQSWPASKPPYYQLTHQIQRWVQQVRGWDMIHLQGWPLHSHSLSDPVLHLVTQANDLIAF